MTDQGSGFTIMTDSTLYNRLKEFLECEGKSFSFNPELITIEYVCGIWGGRVCLENIEAAMTDVRKMM